MLEQQSIINRVVKIKRITRLEYLGSLLLTMTVMLATLVLMYLVPVPPDASKLQIGLSAIFFGVIGFFGILQIALGIARLHDTGHSGWWFLLQLVLIANIVLFLYMLLAPGTKGDNKFGPQPMHVHRIFNFLWIICLAIFIPLALIFPIDKEEVSHSEKTEQSVSPQQLRIAFSDVEGIRAAFEGYKTSNPVPNDISIKELLSGGYLPSAWGKDASTANPWGGSYNISKAKPFDDKSKTTTTMLIEANGLPEAACNKLATSLKPGFATSCSKGTLRCTFQYSE